MASYEVRLYKNSGFNAVNIPDSPALLNTLAYVDVSAVEILQQMWLDSIQVSASWSDVEMVDYARVGNFYYFVNGVTMLSTKTARLALIPDFLTSAGGTKNPTFDILDGITDRATISKDKDTWGAYTEADPLLSPNQPLQLVSEWKTVPLGNDVFGERLGTDQDPVFIESTLDFADQLMNEAGKEYQDETGGSVVVPKTYSCRNVCSFGITGDENSSWSDGTAVYNRDDTTALVGDSDNSYRCYSNIEVINQAFSEIRALGIEGGIINQWTVPKELIGSIDVSDVKRYKDGTESPAISATDTIYKKVSGASGTFTAGTDVATNYATPRNLRLLYGESNRYGLMTCSGDSMTAKPEELLDAQGTPMIAYKVDPRPDGKPYYRFETINGDTNFWRNCIGGSVWARVPFVYQGASGTALNRISYDNSRYIANVSNEYTDAVNQQNAMETNQALEYQRQLNDANLLTGVGSTLVGTGMGLAGQGLTTGLIGAGVNAFGSGLSQGINREYLDTQTRNAQTDYTLKANQVRALYLAERNQELSNLYVNNLVYTPTVNFPYNADIIRDVENNGVLIYKYRLSDDDITRLDKILTMYGYKESEALTMDNFNRRPKFDYVACSSVTIGGKPRWWNDGIASQLKTGVRIWHVLPTVSAYTDNE